MSCESINYYLTPIEFINNIPKGRQSTSSPFFEDSVVRVSGGAEMTESNQSTGHLEAERTGTRQSPGCLVRGGKT